jgi:hypothetical protein
LAISLKNLPVNLAISPTSVKNGLSNAFKLLLINYALQVGNYRKIYRGAKSHKFLTIISYGIIAPSKLSFRILKSVQKNIPFDFSTGILKKSR